MWDRWSPSVAKPEVGPGHFSRCLNFTTFNDETRATPFLTVEQAGKSLTEKVKYLFPHLLTSFTIQQKETDWGDLNIRPAISPATSPR